MARNGKNGNGHKHNGVSEASEVDSPFIWKDIHLQNREAELTKNGSHKPIIKEPPVNWLALSASIFIWHHLLIVRYLIR